MAMEVRSTAIPPFRDISQLRVCHPATFSMAESYHERIRDSSLLRIKGLKGGMFDFNGDGVMDLGEEYEEFDEECAWDEEEGR